MTTAPPIAQSTLDTADRIRADADAAYSAVRGDPALNVDAIRVRIAALYLAAQTSLQTLEQGTSGYQQNQLQAAMQAAFGCDSLAGSDPLARAQMATFARDAQDRADLLDTPQAALAAQQRATDSNDELMARAIARRAWDSTTDNPFGAFASAGAGGAWGDVLSNYVATRPTQAAAVDTLQTLQPTGLNAATMFAFMLPTPSELTGMNTYRISQIAAQG